MINHVYGNKKIKILKYFKLLIANTILFCLNFFYKFDKNQRIIISSAMYAPWIEDKNFYNLFSNLNDLTIIDEPRAYTLWHFSKSLANINGDILDIGCMKGGAGILMSKANKSKKTIFSSLDDDRASCRGC